MIRKAIVLAAGRGTRMGSLTEELPKPMLRLEGKPMLEHIIERLRKAGIGEILVVVGYRGASIVDHFDRLVPRVAGLQFAVQEVVEGTAAAARLGRDFVDEESFLLTFGDIICAASNYSGIAWTLEHRKASAAIGVKRVDDPWQGAAVYADRWGRVTRIVEKPERGTSATRWNSAGLYAFASSVFSEIERVKRSPRGEYEITSAVEQLIESGQAIQMFEMTGEWRDVGRPEDLGPAAAVVDASRE